MLARSRLRSLAVVATSTLPGQLFTVEVLRELRPAPASAPIIMLDRALDRGQLRHSVSSPSSAKDFLGLVARANFMIGVEGVAGTAQQS